MNVKAKLRTLSMLYLLFSFSVSAQNNQPYLGQTPPGLNSQRFPPDSLLATNSWMWHGSPMFTCDGTEMFWTAYSEPAPELYKLEIFTMRVENSNWSPVQRPVFADTGYKENNPLFNSGNDSLYYYSERTTSFINRVVRSTNGWDPPQTLQIPVPAGFLHGNTFSVNTDKDIYLDLLNQTSNESNIFISRFQNGSYQSPQELGTEINSAYNEHCPFIDPDEQYLIFGSDRPGGYGGQIDLYISFKNEDQTWSDAINMGVEINQTGAFFPIVTLDKQYLFFTTARSGDIGYNPYWISADVIDSLQVLVGVSENQESSENIKLYQNFPNPVIDQTSFVFELNHRESVSLEVYSLVDGYNMILINNKVFPQGKHSYAFDASELSQGVYFYKLVTEQGSITRKMIVIKG